MLVKINADQELQFNALLDELIALTDVDDEDLRRDRINNILSKMQEFSYTECADQYAELKQAAEDGNSIIIKLPNGNFVKHNIPDDSVFNCMLPLELLDVNEY